MSDVDEPTARLLTEIRDELRDGRREQAARLQRMVELYEQVLAGQAQALATQARLTKRMRPMLLTALILILVILAALLSLVLRLRARYG
jgi:hypothetical protein